MPALAFVGSERGIRILIRLGDILYLNLHGMLFTLSLGEMFI